MPKTCISKFSGGKKTSKMSFLEVGDIAFGGTPGIITYTRTHHLLALQQDFNCCAVPMRERPRSDVSDGVSWWCPSCKSRKSIRAGSFFKNLTSP